MLRRTMALFTIILIMALLGSAVTQNHDHALFVRTSAAHSRVTRAAPLSPADVMARNILEWIQGIYRQGTRKTRQQSADPNVYLPPYSTQRPPERPRPFQSTSTLRQSYSSQGLNEVTNYPGHQQPSSLYTPPNTDRSSNQPSSPDFDSSSFISTQKPNYQSPNNQPASNFGSSSIYKSQSIPSSLSESGYPSAPAGYPSASATYIPPQNVGYQTSSSRPSPSNQPSPTSSFSSSTGFSSTFGYPSPSPSPSFPSGGVITGGATSGTGSLLDGYPSSPTPSPSFPTSSGGESEVIGTVDTGSESSIQIDNDDDLKHPPHIHNIDVQCSKTMMTINIEFNRAFDGVIYSKGYYANPNCRYVGQNTGQTKYSFTVSLDSCGTQFINDFEGEAGQAYLENVLVLQNELGIQEVWDTIRRVRCLWEGNINKALSVSLSVDMLNQETVTFSGDTATARLDIQTGKGPFAPAANGLVKIGETMTLVVSVEGDPGFDLQVRDCVARDESSTNVVQLTDGRGCILKPKLFGAFQKTKDTGNTGASIIAYAFFQAFKFPDVMDLFIECNVELCKTDCEACPDGNQQIEPGRRRRDVIYVPSNSTESLMDAVRVGRGFRVIMPDDLSQASSQVLDNLERVASEEVIEARNVCLSHGSFYGTVSLMLSLLVVTTISSAILYIKLQRIYTTKAANLPKGH